MNIANENGTFILLDISCLTGFQDHELQNGLHIQVIKTYCPQYKILLTEEPIAVKQTADRYQRQADTKLAAKNKADYTSLNKSRQIK